MTGETSFLVISWDEQTISEIEGGAKISHARVKKSYSGELEGSSTVDYLMFHRGDGTATFTGFELFDGSIQGKKGSVVLSHAGTFEGGFALSQWQIVANSGRGDLAGATGAGSYRAGHDMKATVQPMIIV